jgi:RNA polymerase sigma-70 factor (ECF subfamily)
VLQVTQQADEQLAAEAAREGSDGPAYVALLERYRQRVWQICYRLLGNEHDAHDAAQEVFIRLFLHRKRFAGHSKYSTWVHGIAVRTCLMMRRGQARRRRRHSVVAEAARQAQRPSRQVPSEGLSLDLLEMLESLDEEDRAMIILKYAEDYSYEELAVVFERSVSACKMRISRARQKIQRLYGDANS